jgi:hypothetical protein
MLARDWYYNERRQIGPGSAVVSRDEHSSPGWVIERRLRDVGFAVVSADYHAPLHGTYLLRKPKPGEQN